MDSGDDDYQRTPDADRVSLLTDVLDTSAVGTFILDEEFTVVWVNEVVEEYFGLNREAILGADKRHLVTDQIQDRFAKRVLATQDTNTYVENFECHICDAAVTDDRSLELWSQPIDSGPYAGGRIEHYTDITDQKHRERELERRRHELEHQTERLENFASVLSHDLRTPLYTAQTYAGVLRENGNAEEAVIAEIEQALDRADSLIDDVLRERFERAQQAGVPGIPTFVDAGHAARGAIPPTSSGDWSRARTNLDGRSILRLPSSDRLHHPTPRREQRL